jgi:hypothetical protein
MEFTNYSKSRIERYCVGYASIAFRESNDPSYALNNNPFVLNSKNDGWFRKVDGNSAGFGIAINDFKITSKNPIKIGHFYAYKCKISYTNWAWEPEEEKDFFWLFVHQNFEVEEIVEYINDHDRMGCFEKVISIR